MYLIKRLDQGGGYLGANPGATGQTWVRDVTKARMFRTREAAQAMCCENETPVALAAVCEGYPRGAK